MAVRRTRTGYQVQWYDADGRFRKRTFRGITREEAMRIERDLLARRDRGEPEMGLQWSRPSWRTGLRRQRLGLPQGRARPIGARLCLHDAERAMRRSEPAPRAGLGPHPRPPSPPPAGDGPDP